MYKVKPEHTGTRDLSLLLMHRKLGVGRNMTDVDMVEYKGNGEIVAICESTRDIDSKDENGSQLKCLQNLASGDHPEIPLFYISYKKKDMKSKQKFKCKIFPKNNAGKTFFESETPILPGGMMDWFDFSEFHQVLRGKKWSKILVQNRRQNQIF